MRKGQVTIFVIVGLIIVAIIVGGIYLSNQLSTSVSEQEKSAAIELTEEESELVGYVEDCLYYISGESLLLVSKNGGYFDAPEGSLVYSNYAVPLYYSFGEENVPTKERVSKEIGKAIIKKVSKCIPDAGKYEVQPLKDPSASVSFSDTVDVELDYPLGLYDGEETTSVLEYFSTSLDLDFNQAYDNAIQLYERQKSAKVQDLVNIGEVASNEDYILKFYNLGNTTIYILEFEGLEFEDEKLEYSFAISPVIDIKELKEEGFLREFVEAVT